MKNTTTFPSWEGPTIGQDCRGAKRAKPPYACLSEPGGSDDARPICTLEETEKDCKQKNMKCWGCGWYGPIPGAKDCNDVNC